ncbi:hypothetical protein D3C86_1538460 [compost metagenome]
MLFLAITKSPKRCSPSTENRFTMALVLMSIFKISPFPFSAFEYFSISGKAPVAAHKYFSSLSALIEKTAKMFFPASQSVHFPVLRLKETIFLFRMLVASQVFDFSRNNNPSGCRSFSDKEITFFEFLTSFSSSAFNNRVFL